MGGWGNQKYLKTNEDGNTKYQNLQDAAKAILIGKFIKIKRKNYKKQSIFISSNQKKKQTKPKVRNKKENNKEQKKMIEIQEKQQKRPTKLRVGLFER